MANIEIRYSTGIKDFKHYTTAQLREEFLVRGLYKPNQVVAVYSHVDRVVTLGCMPVDEVVQLEKGMDVWKNFGTKFMLERRELGMFNIGGPGTVTADGQEFELANKDCLYITQGTKTIDFKSLDSQNPAKFFMVSAPAHRAYTTKLITINQAAKKPMGTADTANKRVIYQFIHPDVVDTCQLLMGLTSLEVGSVWNTMPSHTHERRMEIYTYIDVPESNVVFHMMGHPQETRHIVMQNEEAVISPSWSIHSGVGTTNYSFIWAMSGENKEFTDMDTVQPVDLR